MRVLRFLDYKLSLRSKLKRVESISPSRSRKKMDILTNELRAVKGEVRTIKAALLMIDEKLDNIESGERK
jgi:hypothetical protein